MYQNQLDIPFLVTQKISSTSSLILIKIQKSKTKQMKNKFLNAKQKLDFWNFDGILYYLSDLFPLSISIFYSNLCFLDKSHWMNWVMNFQYFCAGWKYLFDLNYWWKIFWIWWNFFRGFNDFFVFGCWILFKMNFAELLRYLF